MIRPESDVCGYEEMAGGVRIFNIFCGHHEWMALYATYQNNTPEKPCSITKYTSHVEMDIELS